MHFTGDLLRNENTLLQTIEEMGIKMRSSLKTSKKANCVSLLQIQLGKSEQKISVNFTGETAYFPFRLQKQ